MTEWRVKVERVATNLFLLAIWILLTITTWPEDLWDTPQQTIHNLQRLIEPFLDKIGLWQGVWYLFAPAPPMDNIVIVATMTYRDADETLPALQRIWRSHNWKEMTWLQRKRQFRFQEYLDAYAQDSSRPVWKYLAEYLARTETMVDPTDETKVLHPIKVDLDTHWWTILGPEMIKEWPEEDRHWLLGDKFQSLAGEEDEEPIIYWDRPEDWKP